MILPPEAAPLLAALAPVFTRSTFRRLLALAAAILAVGYRATYKRPCCRSAGPACGSAAPWPASSWRACRPEARSCWYPSRFGPDWPFGPMRFFWGD